MAAEHLHHLPFGPISFDDDLIDARRVLALVLLRYPFDAQERI